MPLDQITLGVRPLSAQIKALICISSNEIASALAHQTERAAEYGSIGG